ncbi:hypothetical protein RDV78_02005 [Bacillota bacterium LX-D]|nr:hypothetical protein [Bacillota bacterium LX-D]
MSGMSFGFSSGNYLGLLLVLLIKFLMIVFVGALIFGAVVWIKNYFVSEKSEYHQSLKNDPILKVVATVSVSILGIILVLTLINSITQPGLGFNFHMNNHMGGFQSSFNIAGILTILINILSFVLVVSIIGAVITYLKNQYEAGHLNFLKREVTAERDNFIENASTEMEN